MLACVIDAVFLHFRIDTISVPLCLLTSHRSILYSPDVCIVRRGLMVVVVFLNLSMFVASITSQCVKMCCVSRHAHVSSCAGHDWHRFLVKNNVFG